MAAAGREVWGEFRPPLRCRVKGERRNDCSPRPTTCCPSVAGNETTTQHRYAGLRRGRVTGTERRSPAARQADEAR